MTEPGPKPTVLDEELAPADVCRELVTKPLATKKPSSMPSFAWRRSRPPAW
jgi:hypothetical protein